jgi:AbrB family looped-hinge helix DNA binding protein
MGGTDRVTVGNKGRVVIPASIRARHSWIEGTTLVAIDGEHGIVLMERDRALRLIREQLAGRDPVASLLRDRRTDARREDGASDD